jgi:hypothetical protein
MEKIPLEWTTKAVFFSQIDWADTRFRITYGRPMAALIPSIRNVGLLNQAVLQEKESGQFRIVAGARRLRALQEIGQEPIECKIAPVESREKGLLLWNFFENLDRGFNPVEQALAVKKLSAFLEEKELIQEYLPYLGLAPKKETLERFSIVAEISPLYRQALFEGRLFPETIELTLKEFRPVANLIWALFVFLHWGFQKQKEFLTELKEISKRIGRDWVSILLSEFLTEPCQRPLWTPQQKGVAIRNFFRACLYPTLTETEKAFAQSIAPLNLDQRSKISPPPFFEGGRYNLEISFSSSQELKESLGRIVPALEQGKFDRLP